MFAIQVWDKGDQNVPLIMRCGYPASKSIDSRLKWLERERLSAKSSGCWFPLSSRRTEEKCHAQHLSRKNSEFSMCCILGLRQPVPKHSTTALLLSIKLSSQRIRRRWSGVDCVGWLSSPCFLDSWGTRLLFIQRLHGESVVRQGWLLGRYA